MLKNMFDHSWHVQQSWQPQQTHLKVGMLTVETHDVHTHKQSSGLEKPVRMCSKSMQTYGMSFKCVLCIVANDMARLWCDKPLLCSNIIP